VCTIREAEKAKRSAAVVSGWKVVWRATGKEVVFFLVL
jgi:hypothetical protein